MNNRGFTMIELTVVIVVLGILAVVAMPNYVDLTDDARASRVQALAGSIDSSASMIFSEAITNGIDKKAYEDVVALDDKLFPLVAGEYVPTNYGYPYMNGTADTLALMLRTSSDYIDSVAVEKVGNDSTRFSDLTAENPEKCSVTYKDATSTKRPAEVTTETSGC